MFIEPWYWVLALSVFGLMAGSFAGAQVWRLRWAQLAHDKNAGEPYSKNEYKQLSTIGASSVRTDRSKCLSCGHTLAWYDLLPVFSWLSTRGTCRYCKQPIGWFELLIESSIGVLFVLSFWFWPYALDDALTIGLFLVWLIAIVVAAVLFGYDYKWSLMPDSMNYLLIVLSIVYAGLAIAIGEFDMLGVIGSLATIGGIYGGLYYFSLWRYGEAATWVGFGDVKLSIALGFFLGTWQMAFLAVFLANLIGTIVVLPSLIRGKLNRKAQIPFGPLLLVATFISVVFGEAMITWYLSLILV